MDTHEKGRHCVNSAARKEGHTRHSTNTARAEILSKLKRGERITSLDAWRDTGCSRLSAVIHWAKRAGYQIHSQTITVPTKGGRLARVSEYWMTDDAEQG